MARLTHSALLVGWAILSLSGCTNLSGLSGSTSFACAAPDGVTCQSVSGTYHNALKNNLPGQRGEGAPKADPAALAASLSAVPAHATLPTATALRQPPSLISPSALRAQGASNALSIRSQTRVLRVWVAPFEDFEGDLHDQQYVYVTVDAGRWLIEHNRRQIREAYAPLRPPSTPTQSASRDTSKPTPLPASAPAALPSPVVPSIQEGLRDALRADIEAARYAQ